MSNGGANFSFRGRSPSYHSTKSTNMLRQFWFHSRTFRRVRKVSLNWHKSSSQFSQNSLLHSYSIFGHKFSFKFSPFSSSQTAAFIKFNDCQYFPSKVAIAARITGVAATNQLWIILLHDSQSGWLNIFSTQKLHNKIITGFGGDVRCKITCIFGILKSRARWANRAREKEITVIHEI